MKSLLQAVRGEAHGAGIGELLVLALLFSAFYLEPVLGGGPWMAALLATCAAGAVALILDPSRIKAIPPLLVAFVAVYALSGIVHDYASSSAVGRYVVRPCAIVALSLFLTTPQARRRTLFLTVLAVLPQAIVTGAQSIDTLVDYGRAAAQLGADGVTGTLGESEANTIGLVAVAAMVLSAGLAFAGVINRRIAAVIGLLMVATCIFSSTRAAVVLVPIAMVAVAAAAYIALRPRAPRAALVACVAAGVASAFAIYGGIEGIYPGAFTGAFSNQDAARLGSGAPPPEAGGPGGEVQPVVGPRGVALLPGRLKQIRLASDLSEGHGLLVFAFGHGYDKASVFEDATVGSYVPFTHRTGVTWVGKILTETGWLGLLAFGALLAWLAWLGIGLARRAADPADRALGFAAPGIAALTLAGGFYTTILDVRAYSALFIVIAAATVAATRTAGPAPATARAGDRDRDAQTDATPAEPVGARRA